MINFDNAATTPILEVAKAAFLEAPQGNPSSSHVLGREAKAALENYRNEILLLLGCGKEYNLYFTSGATESCNWMVKCLRVKSDGIMYNDTVHHAVSEAIHAFSDPNAPRSNPSAIISLVNNETGQIHDIGKMPRKSELLACDMTAAIGHTPVNIGELSPDYAAFGGHKFGAPKGIGALIVHRGAPVRPMVYGGAQERGMRGGTTPVPLAAAMATALAWRTKNMVENAMQIRRVRDHLIFDLAQLGVDFIVNLNDGHRKFADHILSLRFPSVYGATLAAALSDRGIMVSTGSACSSGDNTASANLLASGLTAGQALSTIRFSFDWYNTLDEVDEAAKIIAQLIPHLKHRKELSP